MTDNELTKAKKEFYERMRKEGIEPCDYHNSIEYETFSCIDMINSILAYRYHKDAKFVLAREYASYHNYLEKYVNVLGEKKVIELIQNQINDIDHINVGVYTDCEGLTYNSIAWVR